MRVIIQRVLSASVEVDGALISKIGKGLLVFAGIEMEDGPEDVRWMVQKIIGLRIFDDADQIPNISIEEAGGALLVVSQFTLHASTRKGNRPAYSKAAPAAIAEPVFNSLLSALGSLTANPVQTGKFGADMQVQLINDGPLTIMIDSKLKE